MLPIKRYGQVIAMGLYLGATVFGGVAAAYPLVRARCGELGDLAPEEVDGLYALSVFLPGPSFLNLWGSVCARAAGFFGAFLGLLALIAPAAALVLALPALGRIPWVAAHAAGALSGAIWATAGLLFASAVDAFRKQKSWGQKAIALVAIAALLVGLHPVILLVLMLAFGAVSAVRYSFGKAA